MSENIQESKDASGRHWNGAGAGGGYFAMVCGLLTVIVISLAFLWFMERRARLAAEGQMFKDRQDIGKLFTLIESSNAPSSPASQDALDLGQRRMINLDGRMRQAIVLDAKSAKRLGLQGGDVILVEQSTTQPSSSPPAHSRAR